MYRLVAATLALTLWGCGKNDKLDPAEIEAKLKADLEEAATRVRNNKVKDGEKIYLKIMEEHPDHPDALAGLGRIRYEEANYEDAKVLLTKALKSRADNPDIHAMLGEVHVQTQSYAEAAQAYGKAFALVSDNSDFGLRQGRNLKRSKQFKEAEAVLRNVAEIDPQAQFVFTELGDVLREQDRLDEALKTYMKAQNLYRSDKMARAGAAFIYENRGDHKHALDEWSAYIRMDCCSDYSRSVAQKKITELKEATPGEDGGSGGAAGEQEVAEAADGKAAPPAG